MRSSEQDDDDAESRGGWQLMQPWERLNRGNKPAVAPAVSQLPILVWLPPIQSNSLLPRMPVLFVIFFIWITPNTPSGNNSLAKKFASGARTSAGGYETLESP